MIVTNKAIRIDYVNYKGRRTTRLVTPITLWFGSTEYHPKEQWMFTAYDHDKDAMRDFALKDVSVIDLSVFES